MPFTDFLRRDSVEERRGLPESLQQRRETLAYAHDARGRGVRRGRRQMREHGGELRDVLAAAAVVGAFLGDAAAALPDVVDLAADEDALDEPVLGVEYRGA